MARLFDDRERAAENLYAREEELNFLARRRGIQMTVRWAADKIELDADSAAAYEARLVDAFIGGAPESELIDAVKADLERAGKPEMSVHVGTQLAQAVAEAGVAVRGHHDEVRATPGETPREEWSRHHPKVPPSWGWGF